MTHKKLMILAAFVALAGAVSVGSVALAYDGSDDHDTTKTQTTTVESEKETETQTKTEVSTAKMPEAQKQKVEQRKVELKQRLETVKTERVEKLTAKRLQACEKRQDRVNAIFDKATERNTKHLAVFQAIEDKVKAFYVSKNLTAEGYDEAVANADAKEAAAVAAIKVSETVTFDCTTTDGAKPGSVIKEAMVARHAALKEYRTAVKDLILVVKKHNGQNRGSDTTTETEATTETEPMTEGAQ